EPKKKEPTKFQDLSKAKTMTVTADSKNPKQPDTTAREKQLAAARANELAELNRNLQGRLSAGGPSGGRANVDDILGPGGRRTASYSLYLASIYRDAWVAPAKSSARKVVRVKVTISKDGTVLSREIIDKSGDRDFVRAAEATVNRVKKFDRPPPINEPSVTYTLEFIPPE
ncbi:MAG: TonB family protein, partial [Limisphaerales bacterium]